VATALNPDPSQK
nr:Chain P, a peptide from osteopontin [synthetic construct]